MTMLLARRRWCRWGSPLLLLAMRGAAGYTSPFFTSPAIVQRYGRAAPCCAVLCCAHALLLSTHDAMLSYIRIPLFFTVASAP
ncbi:hypothetical protein C7974DRAFT_386041 [Boeremia exigua]|uniref:uncharacterized protein n=1 Tax=Boeremia exigua TaxID=749465 RepID=UPI001E8E38D5|nr:uncharacterized protein C7974DRAFT_386041 [Boeremia exigua]KAH6642746.1 hypothetical protein C7974DRAFT_386041 [Boeremia exigua]